MGCHCILSLSVLSVIHRELFLYLVRTSSCNLVRTILGELEKGVLERDLCESKGSSDTSGHRVVIHED